MVSHAHESHILDKIRSHSRSHRDQTAITFIHDSSGTSSILTWCEVETLAWRARLLFRARGLVPGDRIALLLPTGEAYLGAFLGALWGGLVPTTLHPFTSSMHSAVIEHEWRGLIETFQPAAVVSERVPSELKVPLIGLEELLSLNDSVPEAPDYDDLRSLTYIQFTSGSTGRPKGLALHWSAIRSNLVAIIESGPFTPKDRIMSWLPLYHDMGLFGSLMMPLFLGIPTVLMDPSLFAANPLLWLRVLDKEHATITVTPPSALQSCMDLLRRRPQHDLDLSSLQQIICGAEPISCRLVDSFNEVLVPYGVSPKALKPVYGLAETTLAVSFPPQYRLPLIDRIERERFEKDGVAYPAAPSDESPLEWVSAGTPLKDVKLRIVDDSDQILAEREVGRILLHSPSLLSAVLDGGVFYPRVGKWLDTGDLGYMADGEVYVTGRRKDLIIKHGRNFAPEHIEELACLTEGVRRAVVFGLFDESRLTERIIVLVEGRAKELGRAELRDSLRLALRACLHQAGYPVDEFLLVGKNSLPRTTSGKVRRQRCRELYLSQQLEVV
jgi:acyl-CoA synthetase (AMP-forming)/AMP-acid ligase II